MDISINSNKYAKQEALQYVADAVDNEFEKQQKINDSLSYNEECLEARLDLLAVILEDKITKLESKLLLTRAALLDSATSPKQKTLFEKTFDDMDKKLDPLFEKKAEQHWKEHKQEILSLKKKYGISEEDIRGDIS